ncbi:hypothetical protein SAY86_013081 [Trapa natans]|uniref:Uncharacterized protein n=1 Tax=Trapa natans TaxID=22666 RepID=A0AAN7LZ18_TRANT|nr:hypothetical protein SAY86_013081 [Trapa natans]
MPAGAKKRKAAKKKKAHQQHQSHEHDDPRHNEEKDSDGGEAEVLSPASQGHNDHFPDDGREDIEGQPSVGFLASENRSSEVEPVAAEGGFEDIQSVEIVKEVKSEDISESKTVHIEFSPVEAVEESVNGSQEKIDPVDLHNGSQVIEDQPVQEEMKRVALEASQSSEFVKQINPLSEEPDQVVESSLVIDSIEPVSSASEKVIYVTEALIEESPADSLLKLKDQDKKPIPPRDEALQTPEAIPEVSSKKIDETVTVVTDEINKKSLSDEREVKLSVTQDASSARASDLIETDRGYEAAESSGYKPLIAPLPKVVRKTSWFSCCGIFDVITGSSR